MAPDTAPSNAAYGLVALGKTRADRRIGLYHFTMMSEAMIVDFWVPGATIFFLLILFPKADSNFAPHTHA